MSSIVAKITAWNEGRRPELLALKWKKLSADAFGFFRGTAHLFYEELLAESLPPAPLVWICGDAHLENLGSYQGEDDLPHFDLNDFDRACLAPAHWDLIRALANLQVAELGSYAPDFIKTYRLMLHGGKPRHVGLSAAQGAIEKLLRKVADRAPEAFLEKRTHGERLLLREGRSYEIDDTERRRALEVFNTWRVKQPNSRTLEPLDICGRIAGNDSLGLDRYMVLVRGAERPQILDMKAASSAAVRGVLQPRWINSAHRVATAQRMLQYVPAAGLSWTASAPTSYTLRVLQPTEDRVDHAELDRAGRHQFIDTWARLIASAHLRTASWQGSATLDQLMAYGEGAQKDDTALLAAAKRIADLQLAAYHEFKAAVRENA